KSRYVGHHFLCRRRGDHGAAHGVALRSLRRSAALLYRRRTVRPLLAPLRVVHIAPDASRYAGAAGHGGWSAHGAIADAAAADLPQTPVDAGDGPVGYDDAARARGGPGAGRMAVR